MRLFELSELAGRVHWSGANLKPPGETIGARGRPEVGRANMGPPDWFTGPGADLLIWAAFRRKWAPEVLSHSAGGSVTVSDRFLNNLPKRKPPPPPLLIE